MPKKPKKNKGTAEFRPDPYMPTKPMVIAQVETTKADIEKNLAHWRMEFCRLSLALASQTLMFAKHPATGQNLESMFHDPHVNDIVDDSISQIFHQLVNAKREIEKSREMLDLLNKNSAG